MRQLLTAVAMMVAVGCGGVDEAFDPTAVSQTSPALEEGVPRAGAPMEAGPVEAPADVAWEIVWEREGPVLRLVETPTEERFYYPVEVTAPAPELPPPACPMCG